VCEVLLDSGGRGWTGGLLYTQLAKGYLEPARVILLWFAEGFVFGGHLDRVGVFMKSFREVTESLADGLEATQLFSWGLQFMKGTLAAPGTLVLVGGRTGAGKSMFATKLMASIDMPALYISMEDSIEVLGRRLQRFPEDRLDSVHVVVPRRPRMEFVGRDIKDSYDRLICPKMVVVDYAQLLSKDLETIANNIAELKGLGRDHGFVTVLLSQLKRPSMADGVASRPTRWDMRDSSDYENSSETIILLDAKDDGTLDAWIEKSKVGPRGASQSFKRGAGGWLEEYTPKEQMELDF
jgi:hypothetical protein